MKIVKALSIAFLMAFVFGCTPDLVVKNLDVSWDSADKNAKAEIANIGQKDAGPFMVYFNGDEMPVSQNHRPQVTHSIGGLAKGDSIVLSADFLPLAHPDNANLGRVYQITVIVDPKEMVKESNENNNEKSFLLSGSIKEDCIDFDWSKAKVELVNNRYKISVDSMWLLDFGDKKGEATKALKIIKKYRMNKQCFVGRPDPSMEYYLVDDKSPVGSHTGEDCVGFNPGKIEVKKVNGSWKIVEGSHWILDFGAEEGEAAVAYRVILKYDFKYICFVGRPDASMTYFRR